MRYDVQQINQNTDMAMLVGQFLSLRKVGGLFKTECPFHTDTDPSFTVYAHSAYCFGCKKFYNPVDFVKAIRGLDFYKAVEWIATRQGLMPVQLPKAKEVYSTPIPMEIIDYWHNQVDREYHYGRMFTDETIDLYKLGWSGTRHTIPIWEGKPGESDVLNVKTRGENPKYLNLKGRGHPRLFNKWVLEETDWAIIFIGEYDALLGTQDGFPCVSGTGGQGVWLSEWTALLSKMKRIYVVPDKGEETSGYNITSQLMGKAKMCTFKTYKDYTILRQDGNDVDYFKRTILNV